MRATAILATLATSLSTGGCGATGAGPAGDTPAAQTAARDRRPVLRLMTYNIRFDNPADGDDAWPHRKERLIAQIRFHQPDVLGVQEAMPHQVEDLASRLPGYRWLGQGRGGGNKGELSAIFYRAARLELLEGDTFWLSETPDIPGSKGWDADLPRIVTWARLRDRETDRRFFFFNTHFDHKGARARLESARLLTARIAEMAKRVPVVVTGDFNLEPSAEPFAILAGALRHARQSAEAGHHGPTGTFSGFRVTDSPLPEIDYIFVSGGVKVLTHGTLAEANAGRYPSDHLPILATVRLAD
jgi:endonuclease/exonuclease/phosphatase family metal-dependent hydrolase